MKKLTAARLREVLNYNPKSGQFTWRIDKFANGKSGPLAKRTRKGAIAGIITNGYRKINIDRTFYRAGRLAFLWMTGKFPNKIVDHINRDRTDDRWVNLRLASHSQNGGNRAADKQKKVPFKGVSWDRQRKRFQAGICCKGHRIKLGYFDNAEDAHAAYCIAAKKYFGEFARTK